MLRLTRFWVSQPTYTSVPTTLSAFVFFSLDRVPITNVDSPYFVAHLRLRSKIGPFSVFSSLAHTVWVAPIGSSHQFRAYCCIWGKRFLQFMRVHVEDHVAPPTFTYMDRISVNELEACLKRPRKPSTHLNVQHSPNLAPKKTKTSIKYERTKNQRRGSPSIPPSPTKEKEKIKMGPQLQRHPGSVCKVGEGTAHREHRKLERSTEDSPPAPHVNTQQGAFTANTNTGTRQRNDSRQTGICRSTRLNHIMRINPGHTNPTPVTETTTT